MEIKIGQIFEDRDTRQMGRLLRVVLVKGLYAYLTPVSQDGRSIAGKRTRISLHGLQTRFKPFKETV